MTVFGPTGISPEDVELHAAFAGIELPVESFDLGGGLVLSQSFAHIMGHYVVATREHDGRLPWHPGPWKGAQGGLAVDVRSQLHVPLGCERTNISRLGTIWWIASLLRLRNSYLVRVPFVSDTPFKDIPSSSNDPTFWTIETAVVQLSPTKKRRTEILIEDLEWVRRVWRGSAVLLDDGKFNRAFQLIDQIHWAGSVWPAIPMIWAALESIFSSSSHELRYRLSANLASYLAPRGAERTSKAKKIRNLYDRRSSIVHGARPPKVDDLVSSYEIARSAFIKMIEECAVPTDDLFEAQLFGEQLSGEIE